MKKVVEFTFQESIELECILSLEIEKIEKDIRQYQKKINNTSKEYIKESYKDMIEKSKEDKKMIQKLLNKMKETELIK